MEAASAFPHSAAAGFRVPTKGSRFGGAGAIARRVLTTESPL